MVPVTWKKIILCRSVAFLFSRTVNAKETIQMQYSRHKTTHKNFYHIAKKNFVRQYVEVVS